MQQGYSGSTVQRKGSLIEKVTSDESFAHSRARQRDLIALSRRVPVLPRIERIAGRSIYMEYIAGQEGLTTQNAPQAGRALRLLHERRDYPHPCMTGLPWLIELANDNLAQWGLRERVPPGIASEYPSDALIHGEPAQLIEEDDGSIVFVDFEGIGMGSRYQDLGFIHYCAVHAGQPGLYPAFVEGYQAGPPQPELSRVRQLAGVIATAYVGFALAFATKAEAEERMRLGLRLLRDTGLA